MEKIFVVFVYGLVFSLEQAVEGEFILPECSGDYRRHGSLCIRTGFPATKAQARGLCGSDSIVFAREPTEAALITNLDGFNEDRWVSASRPSSGFRWTKAIPRSNLMNLLQYLPFGEWTMSQIADPEAETELCVYAKRGGGLTTAICTDKKQFSCLKTYDSRCPPGFLRSGSSCLYASPGALSWSDAHMACQLLRSELLEMREPSLYAHGSRLSQLLATDHWTGVMQTSSGDYRMTSDGSRPFYSFFNSSHDVSSNVNGQDRCVKFTATGDVTTASCEEKNHFICLYKPRPHCPAGFVSFGATSDCLFVSDVQSVDIWEASRRCRALQGSLSALRSLLFLNKYAAWSDNDGPAWTGITDISSDLSGVFATPDGLVPALLPWSSTQDTEAGKGCTSLVGAELVERGCSLMVNQAYMCTYQDAPDRCPAGSMEKSGRCYYYSSDQVTFSTAEDTCRALGSVLAVVDTALRAIELADQMFWPSSKSHRWYIGLTRSETDGIWQNVDGSQPSPDVWHEQPSDGDDRCAVLAFTDDQRLATTVSCRSTNKFICQWQPVSPGNYDPRSLTPGYCSGQCHTLSYKYAAVKNGTICLCSPVLRIRRVDDGLCGSPCADSGIVSKCGGSGGYISVYRSRETPEIFSVELSVSEDGPLPVNTDFHFQTSVNATADILYSYDFGDGSGLTKPAADIAVADHKYSVPGNYTVTVIVTDALNIANAMLGRVSVNVAVEASALEMECPHVVEPGEEFSCDLWLAVGNHLTLTLTRAEGQSDVFVLPDADLTAVGLTPPHSETNNMMFNRPSYLPPDVTRRNRNALASVVVENDIDSVSVNDSSADETTISATTVVMPEARIPGRILLMGFEYYVTQAGDLDLAIFRPYCVGCDSVDALAHIDGTPCSDACVGVEEEVTECQDLTTFRLSEGNCQPEKCDPEVADILYGYRLVWLDKLSAVEEGHHQKLLEDTSREGSVLLQPGDVVGYISHGAVLGWRPVQPGEVSDIGSTSGTWAVPGDSGPLGARHMLRALLGSPLHCTMTHTYDTIGEYLVSAHVVSDSLIPTEMDVQLTLYVQVPVRELHVVMDPEHVVTGGTTTATVSLAEGSFVTIQYAFGEELSGDAGRNVSMKSVENGQWSESYQYSTGDPGSRIITIRASNEWGSEEFQHTLYVQNPVTELWTLLDNAPVLWPVPGDVNFTIFYPADMVMPSMAVGQLDTGDGHVVEWQVPEQWPVGTQYQVTFNRTYADQGDYDVALRMYNLVSETSQQTTVSVWEEIQNLTTSAFYLPFLPIGGEEYLPGHGPEFNSFPIERNVSFFLNVTQGKIFEYVLQLSNGTFLTSSVESPINYTFTQPGTYSVSMYASNPVQGPSIPYNTTIKVLESPINAVIDDYLLVSEAGELKNMEIRLDSVGTYACLIWNPGDQSKIHAFGDRGTCRDEYSVNSYIYGGPIRNPTVLSWTYYEVGQYTMHVHAFNFLSSSSSQLTFTVSSVPCRPPALQILYNSTLFWQPSLFYRKDPIELVSVGSVDCNASLSSSKRWSVVQIDEAWGTQMDSIDISELDSYQKSILFIPPRFMEYGTFRFDYELQISGDGIPKDQPFVRSVHTFVRVIRSPLDVNLFRGGAAFTVRGNEQSIVLDPAAHSRDQDNPHDHEFVFLWFCRRLPYEELSRTEEGWLIPTDPPQNPIENSSVGLFRGLLANDTNATYTVDMGGCFGLGPGMLNISSGRLDLSSKQFRNRNATYEISVQVRKQSPGDDRRAVRSIILQLVPGDPPIVTVRCQTDEMCRGTNGGSFVNPSSRVALVGRCEQFCTGPLRWSWLIFAVISGKEFLIPETNSYIIGAGKSNIVIKKKLYSMFADVTEFHVKLLVYNALSDDAGVSMMYLLMNRPPSGGQCRVLPPRGRLVNMYTPSEDMVPGRALTENWIVECDNFTDPDGDDVVRYVFYLKHSEEDHKVTVKFGRDRRFEVVLPFGDWELYVTAFDQFQASSDFFIDFVTTTLPSTGEYFAWKLLGEVDRAVGEGNQARVGQLISAHTSILDQALSSDTDIVTTTSAAAGSTDMLETSTIDAQQLEAAQQLAKQAALQKRAERANENNGMLNQLMTLNTNTLSDCTLVLGTTGAVIGDGKALDSTGKDLAVSMAAGRCSRDVLLEAGIVDPLQAETMVASNVAAISAVGRSIDNTNLDGELLPTDLLTSKRRRRDLDVSEHQPCGDGEASVGTSSSAEAIPCRTSEGLSLQKQKQRSSKQVPQMMTSVKRMQDNLLSLIFPGETPFTVKSPDGMEMTLAMMDGVDLGGFRMWQGGGLYEFPHLCAVLHLPSNCSEASNMTVGIQAINWPTLLYSYGGGTELVNRDSSNQQLQLMQLLEESQLVEIPVRDLPPGHLITVRIPRGNDGETPDLPEPSTVEPLLSEGQTMVYHGFSVTRPHSSINIEVSPSSPQARLLVFLRRTEKPTPALYDWVWRIQLPQKLQSSPDDEDFISPVHSTQKIYENVRLRFESNVLLSGPDGLAPSVYPLYDVFVPDWYVRNRTGEYWLSVAELSGAADQQSSFYDSPVQNLTSSNLTDMFTTNYTLRVFTSSCLFYDTIKDVWNSDGCTVTNANYRTTTCACNHLTSFGSGFFVVPNTIDFDYVFANASFTDNLTIYITLIVTALIYIGLLSWARWQDKKDLTLVGATPLPDNCHNHKYLYEILVLTGSGSGSQCDSRVQFVVSGEDDETAVRTLADPRRAILRRGATDSFVMAVARPLGSLNYLRIWHDNSGRGTAASWHLSFIVFRDLQTGTKYQFIANRWFAVEEDDFQIDRVLPVAGREQMMDFQHLFHTTSRKNLSDGHLWFSVFLRPPRSRFTRAQRVSACMALLYLSMLVNAMWYGLVPDQPSSGSVSFGPFSLSPAQIGVGIMSNLIVFPPSLFIVMLFRKARVRQLGANRLQTAVQKQRGDQLKESKDNLQQPSEEERLSRPSYLATSVKSNSHMKLHAKKRIRPKKPFLVPWWCRYIAWFLCYASMAASVFFLWAYGITFGNEKTTKWLTSLCISFLSSIFLTQPLKVFLTAMVLSSLCKKLDNDHDDIDEDEKPPELEHDEEWLHPPPSKSKSTRKVDIQPIDAAVLQAARMEREKELKMWDIMQEMVAYAFFIWILLVLSYGSRDPNAFLARQTLENSFIQPGSSSLSFNHIRNASRFWIWARNVAIPELLQGRDYSGYRRPAVAQGHLTNDPTYIRLGYAVMRQVRIQKENTCRVPEVIESMTRHCHRFSSIIYEEKRSFGLDWNASLADVAPYNLQEYEYRTADSLDSYPFWGDLGWYGGGGYVVELKGDPSLLIAEMSRLQRDSWVDVYTRAVFVEFSLYSAQVNLFVACTILAEFGPDGGIIPHYKFYPVRLLNYHSGFGLFVLICDCVFLVFIVYYMIREIRKARRQKSLYLRDPWNYLEVCVIGLGWTGIVFYLYRTFLSSRLMGDYKDTQGHSYIKLQYVTYLDEVFSYMIGFLVFCGTLKFIKLLRFNKRMGFLTSTLKNCAGQLYGFVLVFTIIFGSFSQVFYLLLGHGNSDFFTFISAIETSFSFMLGNFDFDAIYQVAPVLGPLMLFVFSISMSCVFINIFLALIIRSFQTVKRDLLKQGNEYEIVDFLMNRIKLITGVGKTKTNKVHADQSNTQDKVQQLPQKTEQILDFVRKLYIDGQ